MRRSCSRESYAAVIFVASRTYSPSSSDALFSLSYPSILENIKNATKGILKEMDSFLTETEEVEKTFIRCRANTQKESQRMESVEPDVTAATQRESHKFIVTSLFHQNSYPMLNSLNLCIRTAETG